MRKKGFVHHYYYYHDHIHPSPHRVEIFIWGRETSSWNRNINLISVFTPPSAQKNVSGVPPSTKHNSKNLFSSSFALTTKTMNSHSHSEGAAEAVVAGPSFLIIVGEKVHAHVHVDPTQDHDDGFKSTELSLSSRLFPLYSVCIGLAGIYY
jgi:hypothetical protein